MFISPCINHARDSFYIKFIVDKLINVFIFNGRLYVFLENSDFPKLAQGSRFSHAKHARFHDDNPNFWQV